MSFNIQSHVKSGKVIPSMGWDGSRHPCDVLTFKDGFSVSIQASRWHYCSPRNDVGPYSAFELGFPSAEDDMIQEYADYQDDPTGTVYCCVPLSVVMSLIEKHGGVKE